MNIATHHLDLRFWAGPRLPMEMQTEAAECGAACLVMISSYNGYETDLPTMRRRFEVSMKGSTLASLITMARQIGLQARPVKMEAVESLAQLKVPCILHWNLNHFVVLKEVTGTGIIIHDPAVGVRKYPFAAAGKRFTGVAVEFTPGNEFKPRKEILNFTIRSLMGRVVRLQQSLMWLLLIAIALQVFALSTPFFMQWLIDDALVSGDKPLITVLCVSFIALALLQMIISAARSWFTTAFATHLSFQWMGNAFSHLLRLPQTYFEKRHVGDIVSRFGSITTIQHGLTLQVVEAIIDVLVVTGSLALMSWYSPKLAALALIAVSIYGIARVARYHTMRQIMSEQIISNAKQQTYFLESVRGIQSIKLNGREEARRVGWMNKLALQFNADVGVARLELWFSTLNTGLFQLERYLIIWMAALMVLDHVFTVGVLVGFLGYKDQFSGRAGALIDKVFNLRMLKLQGQRVADILMSPPEQQIAVEIDHKSIESCIEFVNVKFRYSDSEPWVLNDVSFTIPAGQFVAFAGASGCGKTTMIKLMLCLLTPNEGEILIGGKKLRQLGPATVRMMVGAVMQDDSLFTGSISENIHFLDPQPKLDRVQDVAKQAAIHDEIMAMPMQYNTLVGDLGTGLSGGQKQRILLVRALHRMPRILVLDEATSHLDLRNEQLVNHAIRNIGQITRVIVAHRPETINMAERVIVLHQGKVVRDLAQTLTKSVEPVSPVALNALNE